MSNRTSAKPSKAALKLHQQARDHNYDDSPGRLRRIIRSRACDLGTALLIYWRGDPNWYRMYPSKFEMAGDVSADVATFDVMVEIEQRVLEGKYKSFSIPYTPFKDLGTNFAREHYSKRNPFEHFWSIADLHGFSLSPPQ